MENDQNPPLGRFLCPLVNIYIYIHVVFILFYFIINIVKERLSEELGYFLGGPARTPYPSVMRHRLTSNMSTRSAAAIAFSAASCTAAACSSWVLSASFISTIALPQREQGAACPITANSAYYLPLTTDFLGCDKKAIYSTKTTAPHLKP